MSASSDWQRNKLVARFWCDKLRALLGQPLRGEPETGQLTLPHIWTPAEFKPHSKKGLKHDT